MDGYAVELGFGPKAEAKISKIGLALAKAGLHSEFAGSENNPHITLSAFDAKVDLEALRRTTKDFASTLAPFNITFHSVAQFITSQNVVYLAPLMTADLLNMYQRFYNRLKAANLEPGFYYRPNAWTPHTTITMKGPSQDIPQTIQIIRKAPVFNIPLPISTISIVWYAPFKLIDRYTLSG